MSRSSRSPGPGIELAGMSRPRWQGILSPVALQFVADLQRRFGDARDKLLRAREERQARLDAGERLDFLEATAAIRAADWTVAPLPPDLLDRRVEITGPVSRKMIINALNSGACVFMADLEDSTSPTWENLVEGQLNLWDAVRGEIHHVDEARGKEYRLGQRTATLMVRPRGWHLPERHLLVDGQPVSASLFDFGLFLFHNGRALVEKGTGPYFYLPKLEGHREARLWNQVFLAAQDALGMPHGTIKATVLIETLPAAFEMDEILYELRGHCVGLNCGRWDYIFSFIKKLRSHPEYVLPDRDQVEMTRHFLRSYSRLLIRTCHRRGAHAMGGMAAQIPIKDDSEANREALRKVEADKLREVGDGHDGTWVAHPGLVAVARRVFDQAMPAPHQIDRPLEAVGVGREDLLRVPAGTITETGLRRNIHVGLAYLEAWLRGNGCVPLHHLMEDTATAEICRAQLWQWARHGARLEDGRRIEVPLIREGIERELARRRESLGEESFRQGRFAEAAELFETLIAQETMTDFLTLPAYERLTSTPAGGEGDEPPARA